MEVGPARAKEKSRPGRSQGGCLRRQRKPPRAIGRAGKGHMTLTPVYILARPAPIARDLFARTRVKNWQNQGSDASDRRP